MSYVISISHAKQVFDRCLKRNGNEFRKFIISFQISADSSFHKSAFSLLMFLVNNWTVNRWNEAAYCTSVPPLCVNRRFGRASSESSVSAALNIYWIFEYRSFSFAFKWVLLVWVMDNFSLTSVSLYAAYSLLSNAPHCLRLIFFPLWLRQPHISQCLQSMDFVCKRCSLYPSHTIVWADSSCFYCLRPNT